MLTPLELDIMKAVWKRPPITVRDVQAEIRPARQLAYTTVMTIMDRLHQKGFLTRTLKPERTITRRRSITPKFATKLLRP